MIEIANMEGINNLSKSILECLRQCATQLSPSSLLAAQISHYRNTGDIEWSIEAIKEYDQKAGNPEFYSFPEEERARWKEAVQPVYANWVSEMAALGLPGQEVLEYARARVKEYMAYEY